MFKFKTVFLRFSVVFCMSTVSGQSLDNTTLVTINAEKEGSLINKNICGHFAEHLGRCIY